MQAHPARQPEVLSQTNDWLVVNKPSGWHCACIEATNRDSVGDRSALSHPVLREWLAANIADLAPLPESGLVHRLDRLTSGCVIAGRSIAAIDRLKQAVRGESESIGKIYLAMASGRLSEGSFELFFRSRYRRSRKISVVRQGANNERGRCRWKVIESHADRTLLEVELTGPGKRHQIRAGLAHLGHPLLGDDLYGGPTWDGRFGLHAWAVELDGKRITAPPPASWPVANGDALSIKG
jgi:23S rRNA-/tRNA-specific pseudouridylate synthase